MLQLYVSNLLETLKVDDENRIVSSLRILQNISSISSTLHLANPDYFVEMFNLTKGILPPPAVVTTLARGSLSPSIAVSVASLTTLVRIVQGHPTALTLIPHQIFQTHSEFPQQADNF
ncbi:hypothetical protein BLNAU_6809 [Blattamonas nauphoetae]|uniref:Uncharacterized protein n=1 Tax=Blattamonas nauphoetae TaxID=2049346 RepID=A0ABQ9Y3J7_9EUKA|nr:hypothetical protein BLNAU_6809 [Blattamonas nauphoetae]